MSLPIPEGQCEATARIASSIPLLLGGIGTSLPAYWAAGAIAFTWSTRGILTVNHLEAGGHTPYAAVASARELLGVEGFEPPSWSALALGARPETLRWTRSGVGGTPSARVGQFRERNVLPVLTDEERALLRSQSGSGAGVALWSHVIPSGGLSPSCSGCCCQGACVSPSPFGVFAGVYSTLLDITAHRVPVLRFLGGEVLPSKVLRRECAVKQPHASRRTSSFVIWIWGLQRREVVGDLRWVCQNLEGLKLLSTGRWCRHCTVTAVPLVQPIEMGLHWQRPDAVSSAHTRN